MAAFDLHPGFVLTGGDVDSKPILFLDIDGVLNSQEWFMMRSSRGEEGDDIDPSAVALLNQILERSSCLIVISSTWRIFHSIEEISKILRDRGFAYPGSIISSTPDLSKKEHGPLWKPAQRGDEIVEWRSSHGHVGPFAVLDDDGDMDAVIDHFVQTSNPTGLLEEHVADVLRLLSGDSSPIQS